MDLMYVWRVLAALGTVVAAGGADCPEGHYQKQEKCHICTECPSTEIIRKECGKFTNRVCGPFKEFNSFVKNGKSSVSGPPPFHFPVVVDHRDWLRRRKLAKDRAKKMGETTTVTPSPFKRFHFKIWPPYQRHKVASPPSTSTKATQILVNTDVPQWRLEQWQELCFGLIGGLAAVAAVLIIYIIVSHCRTRRAEKSVNLVADNSSIYQRGRIFSRDRLNTTDYKSSLHHLEEQLLTNNLKKKWMRTSYNPNSHFVEGNIYADEVFEPNPYQSLETLIGSHADRMSSLPEIRVIDNPAPPVPEGPRPVSLI